MSNNLSVNLALSPSGNLYINRLAEQQDVAPSKATAEKLASLFDSNDHIITGLFHLGLSNLNKDLPPDFIFWKRFAERFVTEICHLPEIINVSEKIEIKAPSDKELEELIAQAPFFTGQEYLNREALLHIWILLQECFRTELKDFLGNIKELLKFHNASWNLVGRICFHLAENKNPQKPFAFLATYTTKLSEDQAPKHVPLGRALEEYAGEKNKSGLLALLQPVQKASESSPFINELIASGQIFQPAAWSALQAYKFLKDIDLYESSGIMVRVPNWWNKTTPPRPQVTISIGDDKPNLAGLEGMLDFKINLTLSNGETLTEAEWHEIIHSKGPLIKIKGQWVEVDKEKLQGVLTHWKTLQKQVSKNGITFGQSMRLLSGSQVSRAFNDTYLEETADWSTVKAGAWLKDIIAQLRNPENSASEQINITLKKYLQAELRPYQMQGVQWLWLLYNLKLGGCLADDMGLGKTIQLISLLLLIRQCKVPEQSNKMQDRGQGEEHGKQKITRPMQHLLIVPASLLGNWQAELQKFAPTIKVIVIHPSVCDINAINTKLIENFDLVITTYAFSYRSSYLTEINWDVIILDEAQTIKNPNNKQTRAVKSIKSNVKFILTGTPIENSLADLWSLFDFFAPGLLGALGEFEQYGKKAKDKATFYSSVRKLTAPYILRRLKTDKRIISDLPDKVEVPTFCYLTKEQVSIYQKSVEELKEQLNIRTGKDRNALVFNYLMRFKQICNHPTQWLGYGTYESTQSGKFARLGELCKEIAANQGKVLIFTQFQEIIPALSDYVTTIFNQPGLILHGKTPIKERSQLVKEFADEQGPPFFILSLKAGGTGLNLTNASHVIHFDRWWNPAVENQATDRAYRIGQKKNVMVYKFICQGTIEEKIDAIIASKKTLAAEVLENSGEINFTSLTDKQLIDLVTLDIHRALQEN